MDNLQKSEAVIARILTHLAETGLKKSDLDVDRLGLDGELQPLFEDCTTWLADERIIRIGQTVAGTEPDEIGFLNCTITAYGFRLLAQGITLDGQKTSMGAAVKEVSSGRSYSSLGDFFGGLLAGFTKSISS